MRVLWADERARFLAALDRPSRHRLRRKAAMLIAYDTGCRVGELAALAVGDFQPERGSLLLVNIKARHHERREVPLHPRTVRAIGAWLRIRPETNNDALFVSQKGSRLSIRQLQDDYRVLCGLAGIAPQGIHTLRHTAATRLLDERVLDAHQVARRLGHRSTSTTLAFYVHASVEAEAQAIRRARL